MMHKIAAALALLMIAGVALLGFKSLREVASERVLCPVIDVDGGVAAAQVTCGAGGYSSIACTNEQTSTNTVYLGGSAVTTSNGYPICSTCTGGSTLSVDTNQGQVYCTSNTASHDGGTPLKCLCGW